MRNTILILLGISSIVIAGFFALSYGFQNASETVLAKEMSTSDLAIKSTDDIISSLEVVEETYTENNDMTLREYFEEQLGYSQELINEFETKFNLDTTQTTYKELTAEQSIYLYNTELLIDYPESPILAKNEEIIDGEVKLNEQGEYSYSLETLIMDVNAMTDEEKATEIVMDICQKHQIDPNGKIKDLNGDIINEIDDAIYEASDHPKG